MGTLRYPFEIDAKKQQTQRSRSKLQNQMWNLMK